MTAIQAKFRRGSTSDHSTFTGADGEVTVDTTKHTVVVHNGIKIGGYPLQIELNSGTNIKTINSVSILASGNIVLEAPTNKNIANGYVGLDSNNKIPLAQIPDVIIGQLEYQGARDMATTLPAASATNKGWYYIASNATLQNGYLVGDWAVSNGTTWDKIDNTDAVQTVAGRTGAVLLTSADLTDLATVITGPLALKAPLASPSFTGIPLAPTAVAGTNTTQLATTAFVTAADNLKANLASPTFTGAPLAPTAAAGTNTTQLATTAFVVTSFAPLASPTFTGIPAAPTAAAGTNTTQLATTAHVYANYSGKTIGTSAQAAYTLAIGDRATKITVTGNIILPANVFSNGDIIILYNDSASVITITPGAGLTMYQDAVVTAKTTLNLAPKGLCGICYNSATTVSLSGKGIT